MDSELYIVSCIVYPKSISGMFFCGPNVFKILLVGHPPVTNPLDTYIYRITPAVTESTHTTTLYS